VTLIKSRRFIEIPSLGDVMIVGQPSCRGFGPAWNIRFGISMMNCRDELTYRNAKSPASTEAGLATSIIALALRPGPCSLFDAFS
jgi:hypothetical protein